MSAPQKPKRHHHHVWQNYLQPWTVDGALYCLQNGRIFLTGTRVIAAERDFYRLQRLTANDVAFLKLLFGKGHPHAVKAHAHLLNNLMLPFQIAEQLGNGPHRKEIEGYLDRYACNVLESIEASFIPSLESALNGDISFYADDQLCIPFLNYLCTQYMRTKGIRERAIALSPFLERIWNIIIHMSATNIGCSLYLERKKRALIIVNNRTDVSFITGDQPAINIKGTRPVPSEHLSIFYPISPNAGLLMADVEEPLFPADGLTSDQAIALNQKIFCASYRQVFGRSEDCLRPFLSGR